MMKKTIFRIAFFLTLTAITLVAVELTLRAFFAWRVGPDVWTYGIKKADAHSAGNHTVMEHGNIQRRLRGTYSKYFPYQDRTDHDQHGEVFKVTINGRGFRGQDYDDEKAPGTLRVITLGASSTFGYYDRDDETYPYYLQEMLNARLSSQGCGDATRFEVINLGIPHLTSARILSLFRHEGLPLSPDVVTFYEGVNNAEASKPKAEQLAGSPQLRKFLNKLANRTLTFKLLKSLSEQQFSFALSEQDFDAVVSGIPEAFTADLSELLALTRDAGANLFVATQQAKSNAVPRDEIKGVTYADEVARVEEKVGTNGKMNLGQMYFLIHNRIMQAVTAWAKAEQVPVVDIIGALDQRRDTLLSWVHLTPEANRIIAARLGDRIFAQVCYAQR